MTELSTATSPTISNSSTSIAPDKTNKVGAFSSSLPPEIVIQIVGELTSDFWNRRSIRAYLQLTKTCKFFYDQYYLDAIFLNLFPYFINVLFILKDVKPSSPVGWEPFRITSFCGQTFMGFVGDPEESEAEHEAVKILQRIRNKIKRKGKLTIGISSMDSEFLLEINEGKDDGDHLEYEEDCINLWEESEGNIVVDQVYNWSIAKRGLRILNLKELRQRFA